ncbi:MAG: SRPBCC family protein [Myxococcota bacterium]
MSDVAKKHDVPAPAPSSPDLELTRLLDAPPALVFDVWTQPHHFRRWFGPHGSDMPFCEIDPRRGGLVHFCHRFGEMEVWVRGHFQEVARPERLVFTVGFVDADGRPGAHPALPDWPADARLVTTVTLEPEGGKTRMTVRQSVTPAEAAGLPAVAEERRQAAAGWVQTLDRLEALARRMGTR